jgi:hypothetical protein
MAFGEKKGGILADKIGLCRLTKSLRRGTFNYRACTKVSGINPAEPFPTIDITGR